MYISTVHCWSRLPTVDAVRFADCSRATATSARCSSNGRRWCTLDRDTAAADQARFSPDVTDSDRHLPLVFRCPQRRLATVEQRRNDADHPGSCRRVSAASIIRRRTNALEVALLWGRQCDIGVIVRQRRDAEGTVSKSHHPGDSYITSRDFRHCTLGGIIAFKSSRYVIVTAQAVAAMHRLYRCMRSVALWTSCVTRSIHGAPIAATIAAIVAAIGCSSDRMLMGYEKSRFRPIYCFTSEMIQHWRSMEH